MSAYGIPVVVKDQIETAGIMTTFGSVAMDGYVPKEDATIISKLKDAGAIILAKTTMPDLLHLGSDTRRKRGVENPYDGVRSRRIEWGIGIAVAANLATVGIGEDTGGSVRLPASFNNLVGLKPTGGPISRHGCLHWLSFRTLPGLCVACQ